MFETISRSASIFYEKTLINLVDPAGLCAIVGATDCERFVSEIRCMIEGLRDARECHSWLKFVSEEALVLDLLAWPSVIT